jgi:hypothetical protein
VTWLYQPLPLASTLTSGADASEALDATATDITSAAGSLTPNSSVALSGSASTCSAGSFNVELLATSVITSAAGSTTSANNSVRLRSRKTGGAGGSATHELSGTTFVGSAQSIDSIRVVSVLLGGTGVAVSQQSFPVKTTSCLLLGQSRTMGQTAPTASQSSGSGSIPSWVQQPTQVDESNFYNTDFGTNTGKDSVWTWTTSPDKIPTGSGLDWPNPMGSLSPIVVGDIHNDLEADDLWNHYMQYKRTGRATHLTWATAWRDWYTNTYVTQLTDPTTGKEGANQIGRYDHIFGQGLCIWGIEQNDPAALATAGQIAAIVETAVFTTENLQPGVTNMSNSESRRRARWLLFMCYYTMVNPIPRWITLRDHLIDCWVESTGWEDSATPGRGIVIGGNHFCARGFYASSSNDYCINEAGYDLGYRHNNTFNYALHNEALWLAYKMTGREDVRNMLIKMAEFTLYYAWDPTHANPFMGSRWGHFNGAHWHTYQDSFTSWPNQGPPDVVNTDPNKMPTDNYEASAVNTLVYGYKLTGNAAFLKRAREHLRQATCYANDSNSSGGPYFKLNQNEVHFFLDTHRSTSETRLFDWNKGMLQYAGYIFENGGQPSLEPSATWSPPYVAPTSPNQVVQIAGQVDAYNPTGSSSAIYNSIDGCLPMGGGSTFATNTFGDVRPSEIGDARKGAEMLIYNDGCVGTYLSSYSVGGAIGWAGGGGHKGTNLFGGAVFDFTDAKWKRHWTGGSTTQNVEVLTGTAVHGVINYEDDLSEIPSYAAHSDTGVVPGSFGSVCWNHEHWTAATPYVPLVADPRQQTFEVTWPEPYPWSATKIPSGATGSESSPITSGPHGWKFPGEWAGLQFGITGKTYGGFVGASTRFTPTGAVPAPSHIWDKLFEVTPDQGGGPQGSIAFTRGVAQGNGGTAGIIWSWRFQWDTGTWHEYSINPSKNLTVINSNTGGGEPWLLPDAVAAATDPVRERVYMAAKQAENIRLNYMNLSDRRWRNLGSSGSTSGTMGGVGAIKVDPDRRLLIASCGGGFFIRMMNLANLVGDTGVGSIPTAAVGGWQLPNVTAAAGFTLPANGSGLVNDYNYGWIYYPPNGKFYRITPNIPGISGINQMQSTYHTNPENLIIRTLERLTPPPIVSPFPTTVDYYIDQPWVWDKITLGTPVPRGAREAQYTALLNRNFFYVPTIQCFAWFPCDNVALGDPAAYRGVYLIKPS